MQIADLRLAVRPRRPYEAMDIGTRLVQAEAGPLWRIWFAVTLPVLAIALLATFFLHGAAMYFLVWWLKPLYDHALLIVLSRRVFGETPGIMHTLRLLAGGWRHGLIGALLWRRLSMSRAYLLPVWLLENLPAQENRARIALLRQNNTGRARWLHTVMLHFESILFFTALSMLFWFSPSSHLHSLWEQLSQGESLFARIAVLLAYYSAMSVIEPFYVAAGFTFYLNRRTELEAWDLELAFRHLRERLDAHRRAA